MYNKVLIIYIITQIGFVKFYLICLLKNTYIATRTNFFFSFPDGGNYSFDFCDFEIND